MGVHSMLNIMGNMHYALLLDQPCFLHHRREMLNHFVGKKFPKFLSQSLFPRNQHLWLQLPDV